MTIAYHKGDNKYAVVGCDGEAEVTVPDGFRALSGSECVREEDQFYCCYKSCFIPVGQGGAINKATALDFGLVIRRMDEEPKTMLANGQPVTEGFDDINPETGQQKAYVVLTDEERKKGFVRPVRQVYVHVGVNPKIEQGIIMQYGEGGCGAATRMGLVIAETYARDPKFYTGTFCVGCKKHLPVGEFMWDGTEEVVGS